MKAVINVFFFLLLLSIVINPFTLLFFFFIYCTLQTHLKWKTCCISMGTKPLWVMTGNPFGIADCSTTATCTALLKKNIVNYVHASSFKERHSQQWQSQGKSQFFAMCLENKTVSHMISSE